MTIIDFNMFNFVNKCIVLQHKFQNMENIQYDKNITNSYIHYT